VDELASMVQRLKHKRNTITSSDRASALRAALADRLPIHTTRGTELIDLASITHIEASGSYSIIHTSTSPKPRLVSRKLGELEATLEGRGFFRAHRSHLVNVKHIVRYVPEKDSAMLHLSDGAEVEVARAKKHVFARLNAPITGAP
jgi:two-component system, LytTR family, response regulator